MPAEIKISRTQNSLIMPGRLDSEAWSVPCLTVCQPWAWSIIHGDKRVENRSWASGYRGWLAIHAGLSRSWLAGGLSVLRREALPCPVESELVYGAVLGIVWMDGSLPVQKYLEQSPGDLYADGPHCFRLAAPIALREPLPVRGRQGIWPLRLPAMLVSLLNPES